MKLLHEPMERVVWRARLMRAWRVRQFAQFGPDSAIDLPEWIYGAHHISIGQGVVILRSGRLSAERESWSGEAPSLTIGDRSMFRTGLTVSASTSVVIEDSVLGGSDISIIDSDHTITDADQNPLWNPVVTEAIRVGAGSWLGDRVAVLRGAQIGRKCIIGANSVVKGVIPDFSVAVGAPARVVGTTQSATS